MMCSIMMTVMPCSLSRKRMARMSSTSALERPAMASSEMSSLGLAAIARASSSLRISICVRPAERRCDFLVGRAGHKPEKRSKTALATTALSRPPDSIYSGPGLDAFGVIARSSKEACMRRRLLLAAVVVAVALGLALDPPRPQAQAAKKVVLAMAVTPPNLVHIPPYLAKDLG